ncbi:tetratricopeptide repeat protein [Marinobacterium arenosum]|uniref:tetratricopeptide repeat protein n=1 Tax=Marinobacterium arenosum TaxID=2862496 RepID=UPI001C9438A2|nr:hypothetical protein [Marinobacterium arenosum]MBY4678779.1 hypothetical protein [Marinobacterium arenosum]
MNENIGLANKLYNNGHYSKAFNIYLNHALKGNSHCCRFVGWMYLSGMGVDRDVEKALCFFSKEGDEDLEARFGKAKAYMVKNSMSKAINILSDLSRLDYPPAHYWMGKLYLEGLSVERNVEKSLRFYSMGARRNHLPSCREEAFLLIKGNGGIRNIPLGFYKYFKNFRNAVGILIFNKGGDNRMLV